MERVSPMTRTTEPKGSKPEMSGTDKINEKKAIGNLM